MIGRILSHYRILKQIGSGGMGIVYEAEDLLDGSSKVAIKTLKNLSSQKTRFLREAKVISKIDHPNIASFYDYGETEDGQPFIVMELVKGKSLDELIKNGELNLSQIVETIVKVANALSAAHMRGIIHRDIKPSNIVVDGDTVKVLDFGIAKQLEITDKSGIVSSDPLIRITETQNGMILGTPLYLSPEQASGEQVDARSDIFSLGAVLYESIAGKTPFFADSVIEICASILRDDPFPPSRLNPTVPTSLEKITLKALAKKPKDRYQSATEMISDLQDLRKTLSTGKNLPPRLPRPFRHSISQGLRTGFVDIVRHPYLLALICLLTAVVGFSIYNYRAFYPTYVPVPEAKSSYDNGLKALNNGEPFQAEKYFEQAIKSDEAFAMAFARHAESLFEMGDIEQARAENTRAHNTLANSLYSLSYEDSIRLNAIDSTVLSDTSGAVKNYRQLANYVSETGKAQAFSDLGKAFERNENLTEAIESYQKALSYNPDWLSAQIRLGALYGRQQDREKSINLFSKALQFYHAQNHDEGSIEVSYQRGLLMYLTGDTARIQPEIEDALKKAQAGGILYQQIKCLLLLGKISRSSGTNKDALSYAEQAVSASLENKISSLHAESLLELGTTYFFQQKIGQAKDTYEEALLIARQYNLTVTEKRTLLQFGALSVNQHKADEALDYVGQVESFFVQGGYEKDMLDILSVKAQAMAIKGDLPAAFEMYNALLAKADGIGNRGIAARSLKGFGTILFDHDNFNLALNPLYESFSVFNSVNRTLEAGYSLFLYADALLQLGHYQQAKMALFKADGLAQKTPILIPRIDLIKAKKALSERQFSIAIKVCQKMFAEDSGAGDQKKELPSTTEARTIIALAFARSGEKSKARSLIEKVDLGAEFEEEEMLAKVYLARAEIMLDNGQNDLAADAAQKAQEYFSKLEKPAFEWQAWLLLSAAQNRLKDTASAKASSAQSEIKFSTLLQKWGQENFNSYSSRPDIKFYRGI